VPQASSDFSKIVYATEGAYDPNDTNNDTDVYLFDRNANTRTLVSAALNGSAAGDVRDVAISADGRFVAFYSSATNLVLNDGPLADVYVTRVCP
jgi:Tol biopolymer transport system component